MFKNVLVLCLGNICRSPIAEYLLRDFAATSALNLKIDSAGLTAMVGSPAHDYSIQVMHERGLDLSPHRAKQVEAAHVLAADLILVMDNQQRQMLSQNFPHSSGKTFRLGEFNNVDIPDPYGEPYTAFADTFKLIETNLHSWYAQLK